MPIKPHQPPNLRLGRGGAASGLSHAYGDTLSTLSTTNAVNGWKRIARIGSSLTPVDLTELGEYTLNDVPVTLTTIFGTVASIEQTLQGVEFDVNSNCLVLFLVRIQDLVPNYQLGQRIRAVLKFKADSKPDLIASGSNAGAFVGYGVPTRLGMASNQYQSSSLRRRYFGRIDPTALVSTGSVITAVDQVIAVQGSHPGWQGFFQSELDEDSPTWSSLTAVGGIYTVEGAALQANGSGTGFSAAADCVIFGIQGGGSARAQGIIEYMDIYWLDDGESV